MDLNLAILMTLLCWGLWGIFDKKAVAASNPFDTLLMTYTTFIPATGIAFVVLNHCLPDWHLTPGVLMWTGLAAICNWLAILAYLKALSRTEASYVLGITAAYPLIMQVLAIFALGESLVPLRIAGSILIAAGVFAIGLSHSSRRDGLVAPNSPGLICLMSVAMFGWGAMGIFDKLAVNVARPLEVYVSLLGWNAAFAILTFAIIRATGYMPRITEAASWKYPILCASCFIFGQLSYLAALAMSSASYVIVITGCYPLVMYFFALLFLREKLNLVRFAGIAVLVLGGILTQITQTGA